MADGPQLCPFLGISFSHWELPHPRVPLPGGSTWPMTGWIPASIGTSLKTVTAAPSSPLGPAEAENLHSIIHISGQPLLCPILPQTSSTCIPRELLGDAP